LGIRGKFSEIQDTPIVQVGTGLLCYGYIVSKNGSTKKPSFSVSKINAGNALMNKNPIMVSKKEVRDFIISHSLN
jgi:hypothetical protein